MQTFTIFLKCDKCVKKICVSLSTISELYKIAIEKYHEEIGGSLIELYLEDKEFAIRCELETLQQLYHGAIVEIRKKETSTPPLSIKLNHILQLDASPLSLSFEKLQLDTPLVDNTNLTNESNPICKSLRSITPPISTVSSAPDDDSLQSISLRDINEKYIIPPNRYYVLLTPVPFTCTHQDIISFFNPLQIYKPHTCGIFFVTNSQRHRIGHCFIVFPDKKSYEAALKLNGHFIAGRSAHVLECNLNEFEKCVKISNGVNMLDFVENGAKRNHIVMKLKGFSFNVDEYQIREWLSSKAIVPFHVYIMYDNQNRNSGVAYLEFKCKQNANRVFQFNNEYLGSRYINVFISSVSELRIHLAQINGCSLPLNLNPYLNCLRMDGIPSICKENDVMAFFGESLGIVLKNMYIKPVLNIAYVEFKTQYECQLALTRNHSYIYCANISALVTLIQVSKYELRSCIDDGGVFEDINNIVSEWKTTNVGEFPFNDKENVNNNVLEHHQIKRKARQKQSKHVVSVRGIPFDSNKQDVLNFFTGYDSIVTKSLRFLKDHKGRFSGQATVAFCDRQQAIQAVKELDRKYIGSRYVLLRLFQ